MINRTCGCSSETCGCCEGTQPLTPVSTVNRPGLNALSYRAGTHGSFLETMKARLATMTVQAPGADGKTITTFQPLRGLTTRDAGDPAIALLDSWATVGDVLAFYQERIANEGYVRTATERRSVLELARLVGYTLRPGVAATVYLVYTLDDNQQVPVDIPAGARSQSVPGPGELPQSFETSDDFVAHTEWNNLHVRLTQPQKITSDAGHTVDQIYVSGTNTNLKNGDLVLLVFGDQDDLPNDQSALRKVTNVEAQFSAKRTKLELQTQSQTLQTFKEGNLAPVTSPATPSEKSKTAADPTTAFVNQLLQPPVPQAASSFQLNRSVGKTFELKADVHPQLLVNFAPPLKDTFYGAWSSANVSTTPSSLKAVYAMRVQASLFGASVPKQPTYYTDDFPPGTAPQTPAAGGQPPPPPPHKAGQIKPPSQWAEWPLDTADNINNTVFLDQAYETILPGSYVVIQQPDNKGSVVSKVKKVQKAETVQRTAYGISGKTTHLAFATKWCDEVQDLSGLRPVLVYAAGEKLTLVDEPLTDPVQVTAADPAVPLDQLYNGLTSGRWVIFSGERADIPGVTGVQGSELLMISGLRQDFDANLPGDKTRTTLLLATPTAYSYKRDKLTIYGNVVKATHGETRKETLGSGDGSQSLQSFALKQKPLTFVPAPTAAGVNSTLQVYINDVQWHEADMLGGLGPKDRSFITKTDDQDTTTVIFGNGVEGARLPSGLENVKAVYRNGIGKPGNVAAGQISTLQTRPLGVKSVINPLRASGGADRENRDHARDNAPLAVMSLDRLVSVQDYADFTRTFAGIGKAASRRISDGRRELVHITIAGADDVPIDTTSDLYRNLLIALRKFGDPALPVQVDLRELKALVLSAKVRINPNYQWDPVATSIRDAVMDAFSFQKRAFGQPALLCEVIGLIQNIKGVVYVDVEAFGGIPEKMLDDKTGIRRLLRLNEMAEAVADFLPPEILFKSRIDKDLVVEQGMISSEIKLLKTDFFHPSRPAQRVDANLADFEDHIIRPAQLAIFTSAVPDTLILNQIL